MNPLDKIQKLNQCPVTSYPMEEPTTLIPCSHKVDMAAAKLLFGEVLDDSWTASKKNTCPHLNCKKPVVGYIKDPSYKEVINEAENMMLQKAIQQSVIEVKDHSVKNSSIENNNNNSTANLKLTRLDNTEKTRLNAQILLNKKALEELSNEFYNNSKVLWDYTDFVDNRAYKEFMSYNPHNNITFDDFQTQMISFRGQKSYGPSQSEIYESYRQQSGQENQQNQQFQSQQYFDRINEEIYKHYSTECSYHQVEEILSEFYQDNPDQPKSAFFLRRSSTNPSDLVICFFNDYNVRKVLKLEKTPDNQWKAKVDDTRTSFKYAPTVISFIQWHLDQLKLDHWLNLK